MKAKHLPNVVDGEAKAAFPTPPIAKTRLLEPITSWPDMYREATITGVEFDAFWYDNVEAGVAYFFRWTEEPRATVLVVWNDEGLTFIECRKTGDVATSTAEALPIKDEVTRAFSAAGFFSVKHTDCH